MHLTQVGQSERGCVRSTSRSAWSGSDVLRIRYALRLGLRPQPRFVARAGVKCIAQILNVQFSIGRLRFSCLDVLFLESAGPSKLPLRTIADSGGRAPILRAC